MESSDINNFSNRKVLVAPLDWGLGHTTRSMPIIDQLLEWNAEVILGGDGRSFHLLKTEYPDLECIELPAYNVRYNTGSAMVATTLLRTPTYLRAIYREHAALEQIIRDRGIDLVVSDNRYGMWSSKIPCAIICHQISIIPPGIMRWATQLTYRLHLFFLNRFDQIWIPDLEGRGNLSGILSHQFESTDKMRFIGPLSRFEGMPVAALEDDPPVLVVLSGPEPQRTAIEKKIVKQASRLNRRFIIVQGKTESYEERTEDNIKYVSFMNANQLGAAFRQTEIVIARSGYSTVMDLAKLGKKAILIPTPGQTEQKYLAEQLASKGMAVIRKQDSLDLKQALEEVQSIQGFSVMPSNELLKNVLKAFSDRMN